MNKNIIISLAITILSIHSVYWYSVEYNHKNIEYTQTGLNIYGIPGSEYVQKWYAKQLEEFKSSVNWENIKYKLWDPKDFIWSKNNDYFSGFNHYRKNNIIWWKWDDLYSVQHTYNIVEDGDGWVDTYIFGGNSGPWYKNVENLISAWGGGRIYWGDNDNLLITEWKGSDVHGDAWNDVFIVNGLKNSYFGDDGIDTAVFTGPLSEYIIYWDSWSVTVENIKTWWKYHLFRFV